MIRTRALPVRRSGDGFQPRNQTQWQRDRAGRVQPIKLPRRGLLATIFGRK